MTARKRPEDKIQRTPESYKQGEESKALASPARMESAFRALEEAAGGRGSLTEILAHAPASPEVDYVLGIIADPMNDARSLVSICATGGVGIGQLLQLLKEAKGAKALYEALDRVSAYLPRIAEDVAKRSLPTEQPCDLCKGLGVVPLRNAQGHLVKGRRKEPCKACEGKGRTEIAPELERQKLALQMGGMLKQAPTVQVDARQQSFTLNADMRRDLRSATDRILFPARHEPPIDIAAKPVPAE